MTCNRRLGIVAALTLGLLSAAVLTNLSSAADPPPNSPFLKPGNDPLPADLALVPPDALGFVSIRVGQVWNKEPVRTLRQKLGKELDEVLANLQRAFGVSIDQVERACVVWTAPNAEAFCFVVTTTKPYARDSVLRASRFALREERVGDKTIHVPPRGRDPGFYFASERSFVVGERANLRSFVAGAGVAKPAGPLTPALKLAAGNHDLVAGVAVPRDVLDAMKEALPEELKPYQPLFDHTHALLVVHLEGGIQYRLQLAFPDEAKAKRAEDAGSAGLQFLRKALADAMPAIQKTAADTPKIAELLKQAELGLKNAELQRQGPALQLAIDLKGDPALLHEAMAEAVIKVRAAANKIKSGNNLAQIGVAMHMHHHDYVRLPEHAIYSKDGKPLLSWRVAILPYIEEGPLYRQFKLDEPWDSEHNKKLMERMPAIYRLPAVEPGKPETHYQVVVGPGTLFEPGKKLRLSEVKDGTSNTLMVVEATTPVPWTKPEDLSYDPKKPLPKLGGLYTDGRYQAVLGDGSVRSFSATLAEKWLHALITRSGNEVIFWEEVDK